MRTPLGPGPQPEQLALRLSGAPGLLCVAGNWADGGAIVASEPVRVLGGADDAFAALDELPIVDTSQGDDIVGGGWFGVLGYDGVDHLAFYDNVARYVDGRWYFEELRSAERAEALDQRRELLRRLLAAPDADAAFTVGAFGGARRSHHLAAVERAVEHIRAGDVYQVNVCTRLAAHFGGDPAALFAAASRLAPAFGAFFDLGDRAIVSASPELFLRRRGRDVLTAPIKGTRARVDDGGAGADELRASVKDAAENVMIVDLMRNDLGRVCATGTVAPDQLLGIEPHPGVWHLVSRVRGRLRPDVHDGELLRATFPPGSVTGAPKVRACEVIADLEARQRGVYTGAVGFVSPVWGAEFSVAIRTFEIADDRIELGVGGGITADSVPMVEWQECLDKAAPLVAAAGSRLATDVLSDRSRASVSQLSGGVLETVLVLDGRPVRLADHLARLDRSVRELYGRGINAQLPARAAEAAATCGPGRAVLRLVCGPEGETVAVQLAGAAPAASMARSVRRSGGLWRHKWADRAELQRAEADHPTLTPLFVAGDGTVLETSRGNVFVLTPEGALLTAPLRDDVLPGVTRRALLDLARDEHRPVEVREFGIDELLRGVPFWTSSLSGAVPIHTVDGEPAPRDDAAVHAFGTRLIGGDATVR